MTTLEEIKKMAKLYGQIIKKNEKLIELNVITDEFKDKLRAKNKQMSQVKSIIDGLDI